MIGLDTNILVRWITGDDPELFKKAEEFINKNRGGGYYISLVVVLEIWWVLTRVYGFQKVQVIEIIEELLEAKEIEAEHHAILMKSLDQFRREKADFEDLLIANIHEVAGCLYTATFDKKAGKTGRMRVV